MTKDELLAQCHEALRLIVGGAPDMSAHDLLTVMHRLEIAKLDAADYVPVAAHLHMTRGLGPGTPG
jgi:hypothetical protein